MRTRLNNQYRELSDRDGFVSAEKLRNIFLGIEEIEHTVLNLFDKKVEQKEALAGISIQESVAKKYACTRSRVAAFIKHHYKKRTDLPLRELGYDFISNFDIYLRSKHHCGHNTVVRYMRYLKQVTTDALKCRYIQIDPFMDYPLTSKKGDCKYLTEKELISIMEKEFATEKLEQVRDVFVFCCMTGFAYIDVTRSLSSGENESGMCPTHFDSFGFSKLCI